jgi:hypothetical protein
MIGAGEETHWAVWVGHLVKAERRAFAAEKLERGQKYGSGRCKEQNPAQALSPGRAQVADQKEYRGRR